MKRVSCLLLILLLLLFSIPIFADTKEYSFDSANIVVFLNEDGSADVRESWKVNYKKR